MAQVKSKKFDFTTPKEGRLSFVWIDQPQEPLQPGGKRSYSVTYMWDKSDVATTNAVKAAIKQAYDNGLTTIWGGTAPNPTKLKLPLKDGDVEHPTREEFRGKMFITARCAEEYGKPMIVDSLNNKVPPTSQGYVYSGCWARVYVGFKAFNQAGLSNGVQCILQGIQKVRDDEKFGGTPDVQGAFNDGYQAPKVDISGVDLNGVVVNDDIFA